MNEIFRILSQLEINGDQCAFPSCVCHDRPNETSNNSMKSCSACGVAFYCSKESQKSDWRRHKKICIDLRPFRAQSSKLDTAQKSCLNSMTLELPPVEEEYQEKHPCLGSYMFLTQALYATRNMVLSNLRNLLLDDDENTGNILKRWQEIGPNLSNFLEHANVGDVFLDKEYQMYSPGAPQQFRNTPLAEPAVFKNGTTVVDVGFVDFGIAFDSVDSITSQGEPVVVLAYDMSSFCVAKSMIMLCMIKDESVKARSIVEVWLSSLWSKATLNAFKRATKKILKDKDIKVPKKIRVIIEYWNRHETMSSEAALKFQMQAVIERASTDFVMNCCSLAREEDRVAYLRYYLTKALFEDETTLFGSIVMNSNKTKIGVKQMFACCFEAAPSRIHSPIDPNFIDNSTFVNRTKSYFLRNMEKLMFHVRNGTLVFIPRLEMMSQNNQAMIDEVKAAEPYIISWSNIVDYMHPKHFHTIAKEMSCANTAHYLHSCNWSCKVFGTDIYDIRAAGRLHFFALGLSFIETSLKQLTGFTEQGTFHFRDICSNMLSRKFAHKFFQYFFQDQAVNCSCLNGNTPLKSAYPFARTMQTAFIVFSYKDAGITFGFDTYDYAKSQY